MCDINFTAVLIHCYIEGCTWKYDIEKHSDYSVFVLISMDLDV